MSRDDAKSGNRARYEQSPVSDANWPLEISDLLTGFARSLNVYRTMANHPELLRAWTDLREHVVNCTSLGPQSSEVVILRAGFRLGSSYEWLQHVKRARELGLSGTRIAALKGPLVEVEANDRVLAAAVDELFERASLSKMLCDALTARVGKAGVMDLVATVRFYSTLGFILNTFNTPLDDDTRAELAAIPLRDQSPWDDSGDV